ncbi:hypothetical protein B0T17DRAFT_642558 [Bombardia bombarda]|uniref:Uncharacterized protein n=1 Tax=Bombardia bombarda TaxID=252184 RepID=A0AA39WV08_9PEZI|nr:hypothetical protein B0T17DRAFT_642558 [Bombardia bombarda]
MASLNSSDPIIYGWKASDNDRGTIDILWTCCITIVLCCWVSTFPNAPSLSDKWYHQLLDKLNLAFMGFIGPEYLFALALNQLSSARNSITLFRELHNENPQWNDKQWTLRHGFFADMGGFMLTSPDQPAFPINAQQLHYLIAHGHVEYPEITKEDIDQRNKTDGLAKLITLWQVVWFVVAEMQRVRLGLPLTTFEVTALSFSFTMIITSVFWYYKPTISTPTKISTKGGKTIAEIRASARQRTHPHLPNTWFRTPLDFISRRQMAITTHWSYYVEILKRLNIPLAGRKIKTRPWDRFPSTAFPETFHSIQWPGFLVPVGCCVAFLAPWNFYFATETEQFLWRLCSVYHTAFASYVAGYVMYSMLNVKESRASRTYTGFPEIGEGAHNDEEVLQSGGTDRVQVPWYRRLALRISRRLQRLRNISEDGDPDMEMKLRQVVLFGIGAALYCLCRIFFYVENFVAMRSQPAQVYIGVNKFIPFLP